MLQLLWNCNRDVIDKGMWIIKYFNLFFVHVFIFMEIGVSWKNNSRKYNGTMHIEDNDQSVQRIKVESAYHSSDFLIEYKIKFTENKLNLNGTFCKGVSDDHSADGAIGLDIRFETSSESLSIDPNTLKSLIG